MESLQKTNLLINEITFTTLNKHTYIRLTTIYLGKWDLKDHIRCTLENVTTRFLLLPHAP